MAGGSVSTPHWASAAHPLHPTQPKCLPLRANTVAKSRCRLVTITSLQCLSSPHTESRESNSCHLLPARMTSDTSLNFSASVCTPVKSGGAYGVIARNASMVPPADGGWCQVSAKRHPRCGVNKETLLSANSSTVIQRSRGRAQLWGAGKAPPWPDSPAPLRQSETSLMVPLRPKIVFSLRPWPLSGPSSRKSSQLDGSKRHCPD